MEDSEKRHPQFSILYLRASALNPHDRLNNQQASAEIGKKEPS
jgi:hypothetical protein